MIALARFASARIGVSAILARAVWAPAMLLVTNNIDDAMVAMMNLFMSSSLYTARLLIGEIDAAI
jgi:hypothetical protein